MSASNWILLVSAAFALSACTINIGSDEWDGEEDWRDRQAYNERAVGNLELGRSLASVEAELGEPDFTDSFLRAGEKFTVLYFRTMHVHSDGRTTKDETTPLVFAGDQLVGWGTAAIDNATAD